VIGAEGSDDEDVGDNGYWWRQSKADNAVRYHISGAAVGGAGSRQRGRGVCNPKKSIVYRFFLYGVFFQKVLEVFLNSLDGHLDR
jgi:hypothetical protein